jgi:DNA-binding MarR family transcriptional regulator
VTDQAARRQDATDAVYREIETISRRVAARSRSVGAPLSPVEHSLVNFIGATPGCRATDIAAAFQLNRSTVSRQLGTLTQLGLIEQLPQDENSGKRGRVLALTDRGRQQLARSMEAHRGAMNERLADWTEDEIAAFAAVLRRFNSPPASG